MKQLGYPFSEESVRGLRAARWFGERPDLHRARRLHKHLAEGGECPVSLQDGALYHCGPVVVPEGAGWRVVAAGPTPPRARSPTCAGDRAPRGSADHRQGGMARPRWRPAPASTACTAGRGRSRALLAQRIRRVPGVCFLEAFGATEALWQLEVEGFEAVVGMDAHGRSLFDDVRNASAAELRRLMQAGA
jgi:fumarate hydratase class I